jgi:hypothetical protein
MLAVRCLNRYFKVRFEGSAEVLTYPYPLTKKVPELASYCLEEALRWAKHRDPETPLSESTLDLLL